MKPLISIIVNCYNGEKFLKEALDNRDIKLIKLIVRDVIADWLRDIWIKRSVWKK